MVVHSTLFLRSSSSVTSTRTAKKRADHTYCTFLSIIFFSVLFHFPVMKETRVDIKDNRRIQKLGIESGGGGFKQQRTKWMLWKQRWSYGNRKWHLNWNNRATWKIRDKCNYGRYRQQIELDRYQVGGAAHVYAADWQLAKPTDVGRDSIYANIELDRVSSLIGHALDLAIGLSERVVFLYSSNCDSFIGKTGQKEGTNIIFRVG